MGVYGYSFNNPMYPSGYGTGYSGTGYGMGYGAGAAYAMPSTSLQVSNAYTTTITQPYMGSSAYGLSGGMSYPQAQVGFSSPAMSVPQTMGMQPSTMGYNPFASVQYPATSSYYAAPSMATQMQQMPMTGYGLGQGTGLNVGSYYPASRQMGSQQLGMTNPFMQASITQMPMTSGYGMGQGAGFNAGAYYPASQQMGMTNPLMQTNMPQMLPNTGASLYGVGGYSAAQPGMQTAGMQTPNMLQMMNPAYSSTASYSPVYGQVPGISSQQGQMMNPFMQNANLSPQGMPPSMNPMLGGESYSGGLASQLPTREELLQLLQVVDELNGEPGRDDALIYGDASQLAAQYDPSMVDPSMMDPSMMDPSMQDPSMMDPMMQDPSMVDPSMMDPSMMDPSMQDPSMMYGDQYGPGQGPGGPYRGYQARYSDPAMYDSAYAMPGQLSPSLYNSSPLNQATNQFRDTMNPNFSMNGDLTQDAKDKQEADKNKNGDGGTPAAA